MQIKEILLKEEEKHRLTYIGLVTNWPETIARTETTFTNLNQSKDTLINLLYNQILNYNTFINQQNTTHDNLRKHHYQKTTAHITSLRRTTPAELDQQLKPPHNITFAWLFTQNIYDQMYATFQNQRKNITTPQSTDNYFNQQANQTYPLNITQTIKQLAQNDPSFWNTLATYLRDLSRTVVNILLQRNDNHAFSDLIKDQTWTDAWLILRERLIERKGNIPHFDNGKDLRNYLIKVCKLIASDRRRKYDNNKNPYIDDITTMKQTETEQYQTPDNQHSQTILEDLNTGNPYEVAHAVSIILLNSDHPLRQTLIQGIEDKVQILISKATGGMTYNDIIDEQYGEQNLSQEDFRRAVVKARKDYERVRKTLCHRLRTIADKQNQPPPSHSHNNRHNI